MSSEPMTEPVGGEARSRLLEERERLSALREEVRPADGPEREALGELSGVDQHPADTATETFNLERDVSLVESIDAELADVETALERLDRGTYGTCVECGAPIGAERLEALPATRYCLDDSRRASEEAAPGALPGASPPGVSPRAL